DQLAAVGSAGSVVHAVAALEGLAEGGAAGLDVDAVGALEGLAVLLDVRPDQAALVVVVDGHGHGGAGAVVVGGPPDLVGAGEGAGAGQRVAVEVGAALPGGGAQAVARQALVDVVVHVAGQADLVQVVGALNAVGGGTHLLDGGEQQGDQHGDDGDD